MNIHDSWEKALKETEVVRPRVQPLSTFASTQIPYVMLSESLTTPGDTVVRKGQVLVEKPSIILPYNLPQFEGFEIEEKMQFNEDILKSFFLVRGVSFPSMKYNNHTETTDRFDGRLGKALEHYANTLQRTEDVHTGLITGPEICWQFSLLIFICGQVAKSADGDVRKLFEDIRRKGLMN